MVPSLLSPASFVTNVTHTRAHAHKDNRNITAGCRSHEETAILQLSLTGVGLALCRM
jgi:hypothetical protein